MSASFLQTVQSYTIVYGKSTNRATTGNAMNMNLRKWSTNATITPTALAEATQKSVFAYWENALIVVGNVTTGP